jgi:hypothetical protein
MKSQKFTVQKQFIQNLQYLIRVVPNQLQVNFGVIVSSILGPKTLILTSPKVIIMPFFAIFDAFNLKQVSDEKIVQF